MAFVSFPLVPGIDPCKGREGTEPEGVSMFFAPDPVECVLS